MHLNFIKKNVLNENKAMSKTIEEKAKYYAELCKKNGIVEAKGIFINPDKINDPDIEEKVLDDLIYLQESIRDGKLMPEYSTKGK